jgi:transposase
MGIEAELAADRLALATLEVMEREGASQAQIAAALNVSPTTLGGWVRRGEALRRHELR